MSETLSVPTDIQEYQEFVAKGGLKAATDESQSSAAGGASNEGNQAETESDSETDKGTQKEPHQKKSGFQRRVDRLNQKLGAREAEIAELRRQLEARSATAPKAGEKEPNKPEGEPQQVEAKAKPQQKDFESYDEYVEALTDWKTEQALEQREAKKRETAQKQSAEDATKAVMEAHAARVDEAKERYDDWTAAFKGLNDESFTQPMMVAIFESDNGPDIAYHLAKNRDELERISKLPATRQVAEIGKIETRFAKEAAAEDDAKPAAKQPTEAKAAKPRVSQAPPPAKPLKGKTSGEDPMPDPTDFAAYEAWAKRQAAAGRKR